MELKFTEYFKNSVTKRRPELVDFVEFVLQNSVFEEIEDEGRMRYYAFIPEIGTWVRLVEDIDGSIHNIMTDSDFGIRWEKGKL
jgi:hypothetical protein